MPFAAILAFFQTPLGKLILSAVLEFLQKSGFERAAEALALKMLWVVVEGVEGLKTYHAPDDFPHEEHIPVTTNLTTQNGTKVG